MWLISTLVLRLSNDGAHLVIVSQVHRVLPFGDVPVLAVLIALDAFERKARCVGTDHLLSNTFSIFSITTSHVSSRWLVSRSRTRHGERKRDTRTVVSESRYKRSKLHWIVSANVLHSLFGSIVVLDGPFHNALHRHN